MLGILLSIVGYGILVILILILFYLIHVLMDVNKATIEIHHYEKEIAKHTGMDISHDELMEKYDDFFNKAKQNR